MYFLLYLSHCVKSYGHLCQILACFTMPTHQIFLYQVTQVANLKNFYFGLILRLILGEVTKLLVEKLSSSEVINQTPPPRLMLFMIHFRHLRVLPPICFAKSLMPFDNAATLSGMGFPFMIKYREAYNLTTNLDAETKCSDFHNCFINIRIPHIKQR